MAITKDEIVAKCSADLIASRDCVQIASIVSSGRTAPNLREIGNGTILDTIGITAGNALLDEINNNTNYRYVKPLVDQGRLLIGSSLVQSTLKSMVPAILTQAQCDSLSALGFDPAPVTPQEVADALYNPDGSSK